MHFSLYVIATLYILHLSQLARYILKNPIYTMPTLYTLHLSQSIIRPTYKTQTYSMLVFLFTHYRKLIYTSHAQVQPHKRPSSTTLIQKKELPMSKQFFVCIFSFQDVLLNLDQQYQDVSFLLEKGYNPFLLSLTILVLE